MAETKTKPRAASVAEFIDAVPDAKKREDARTLCAMMERVTGEKPVMWGPSIVGFGTYHYKYESGHEGDTCAIGFSPRATALTLYLSCDIQNHADRLARLGKHKTGKGCLYIKRLSDVDEGELEALMKDGLAEARRGQAGY